MAQNTPTDIQDTSIDINQIYINIIQEIDKYRSHVSIANNTGLIQQLIKALDPNSVSDPNYFITQVKVDQSPQESRCHTFYRLIGLPIIEQGGNLFSPGFDKDNGFKSTIASKHYQIIRDINNQKGVANQSLFKIMDDRENNINAYLKIFSLSDPSTATADINASVLTLSSIGGGKTRKFSASLENSDDTFDTEIKNQSYAVIDKDAIGGNKLSEYTDSAGNHPALLLAPSDLFKESLLTRRAHILKPFIVDPRIDLTVNPPHKMVCAPFATSTAYTEDIALVRPFIEYVCRGRFNKDNVTGVTTTRFQDIENYIKNTDAVKDQALLNKVASGITQIVEIEIFLKNINIMRAMIDLLYNSIGKIQDVTAEYYWIPVPSQSGLEDGIVTQDITLVKLTENTAKLNDFSTQTDTDIFNKTAQTQLANVNSQNTQVNLGNFAFQSVQPLPDAKVTEGIKSRNQTNLDNMVAIRKEKTDDAATALKNIEIIMGEFTGLGFCDIIAIYTALWTVDKEVLVNLLDDEAFARLYQDSTLRIDEVEARNSAGQRTVSGSDALQRLENKIKEMYKLMDKILEGRSADNTK